MEEQIQNIHHVTKHDTELKTNANKIIKINADMLCAYIDNCKTQLVNELHDDKYLERIAYNVACAQKLLALAEGGELHEFWERIDSGREYGRGHSIQRVAPSVREAALGYCHRYEFRANTFALLACAASDLNPSLRVASIKNYIIRGAHARTKLASESGLPEWQIKDIINSLVFCPDINHKLSAHQEFEWLQEEHTGVTETILSLKNEIIDGLTESRQYSGKRNDNAQFLAWFYQVMETRLLDRTTELLTELGCESPLLIVHDCIYLKHKMSPDVMQTLVILLQNDFKHISLEYSEVIPMVSRQKHAERYSQEDHDVTMHHARIAQAEKEAIGYKSVIAEPSYQWEPMVQTPYGEIPKRLADQFDEFYYPRVDDPSSPSDFY